MIRNVLIALVVVLSASRSVSAGEAVPFDARARVAEAVAIARVHAYRTAKVDWPALEARLQVRSASARDGTDLLPVYVALLDGLGDGHSFLQVPEEQRLAYLARHGEAFDAGLNRPSMTSTFIMRRDLTTRSLALRRGRQAQLLTVPKVFGGGAGARSYANTLFDQLAAAAPSACGYVLDLRGNVGGNVWPMLAGLSPLLGDGNLGGERNAAGALSFYARFESGAAIVNEGEDKGATIFALDPGKPRLDLTRAPVALLIDDGVASSGEGVAVAFKGRAATRFFGSRTFGVASSNEGFQLSGGENLVITTAMMTDRNGRTYPSGVAPDSPVAAGAGRADDPDDAVIEAAKRWLEGRRACR